MQIRFAVQARGCLKTATLVAEKVDVAGRHVRQIELCPSTAKSLSSASVLADLRFATDDKSVGSLAPRPENSRPATIRRTNFPAWEFRRARQPSVTMPSLEDLDWTTRGKTGLLRTLLPQGFGGGGPFRARTGDPLIKSQLLYQLS
jgi:hypothetical protein